MKTRKEITEEIASMMLSNFIPFEFNGHGLKFRAVDASDVERLLMCLSHNDKKMVILMADPAAKIEIQVSEYKIKGGQHARRKERVSSSVRDTDRTQSTKGSV